MGDQNLLHAKSSLYVTFKVVQLVNHLRKRLKPRVLQSKAKDPEVTKQVATTFANDARKGSLMLFACKKRSQNRVSKHRNGIRYRPAELEAKSVCAKSKGEVKNSLEELSDTVREQIGFDIVQTAEDDHRFLRSGRPAFDHLSWLQAAHNIQLVNAALGILVVLKSASDTQALSLKASQWSADEKTCANLEHLLLCIREQLTQTFITKVVESVCASFEWQNHWRRQLKFGGDKWCAEFSNNQRPISTTWPWSIRPSLAVLWGVCWMFYPVEGHSQNTNAETCFNWVGWQNLPAGPQFPVVPSNTVAASAAGDNVTPPVQLAYTEGASAQHLQAATVAGTGGSRNPVLVRGFVSDAGWSPEYHQADSRHRHILAPRYVSTPSGPRPTNFHPHRHLDPSSPPGFQGISNNLQPFSIVSSSAHLPSNFAYTAPQGSQQGTYAAQAAARHQVEYNRPPDALTRAAGLPPQFQGPVASAEGNVVNQSTWPLSRPQVAVPATATSQLKQVFGHRTQPFQLTPNPVGVTGYQLAQTQPHSRFSSSPSPRAPINTEQVRPEDLPAFLTPNINTIPQYREYQYYLSTMSAADLPTDPALTAGEDNDLKPQDAVQLAVGATQHNLTDTAPHGDMSEDPSSPDGIEPFSPRRGFTHKRNEEPPRNEAGKMICKFQNTCVGLTFDRRCEWSKHMDKHERPYKCTAPGCEKLQGFTYSGGLLRHQREVHKMHGGTKKALYCPEPNCKRNSGAGFTRKENLSEHIRRVHRRATDSVVPYADGSGLAPVARMHPEAIEQLEAATREEHPDVNDVTDPALTAPMKRKHDEIEPRENGFDGTQEVGILKDEVKRLKADLDARDNRLKTLEDQFHKQTELLQQLLSNKEGTL